jgi:pyruvate-formate lyase-activating enzyme
MGLLNDMNSMGGEARIALDRFHAKEKAKQEQAKIEEEKKRLQQQAEEQKRKAEGQNPADVLPTF